MVRAKDFFLEEASSNWKVFLKLPFKESSLPFMVIGFKKQKHLVLENDIYTTVGVLCS